MTRIVNSLLLVGFSMVVWQACQKTPDQKKEDILTPAANDQSLSAFNNQLAGPVEASATCAGPYTVILEGVINNNNGTWTWTWSVANPNPGNGTNGTVQNLSHWAISLGQCATIQHVISGAYSANAQTWTSFTPTWAPDPSLSNPNFNGCSITNPVLKFDFGTTGTAKSYYRLTVNQNFQVDPAVTAWYKSGGNTGCGSFCFAGFGCVAPNEGCSYSQGYWFAKPGLIWPDVNAAAAGNVTIGGHHYTQAEGKAIWNASNTGGIADTKKGFLQVAAIKLSGSSVLPAATVWADVTIVENWLSTLPKLTTSNLRNYSNSASAAAAGRIGEWINYHHCD